MSGIRGQLQDQDISILAKYAQRGNRELYWNYLAGIHGNDGYGRLALGVVRNDNMPGATANAYAQSYARDHDGKVLTEREWDHFGVDLIRQDLVIRQTYLQNGDSHKALNLPGKSVQDAHDAAFSDIGVDPNAWTPRKLLEASRASEGNEASEAIWKTMLDNDLAGGERGLKTLGDLAAGHGMSVGERATYTRDLASAWGSAINARSHESPNVIGTNDHFYMRDKNGDWMEISRSQPVVGISSDEMRFVTDSKLLRELEDTHQLRLERQDARQQFNADDPGKLISSPHPLADTSKHSSFPSPGDDPLYASIRSQLPMDVSDDKAAQAAVQARYSGIANAGELRDVQMQGNSIICNGIRPGVVATIGQDSPAPPMGQSVAQARTFDAQSIQQAIESQALYASQQAAVQPGGPSMSL